METIRNLINNPWIVKTFWSLITIIIGIVLYNILTNVIINNIEKRTTKVLSNKKTKTYIRLIKSISKYFFIICTTLAILQIYGVNISSVIAGVGVLGVIFGLAIQDWLKDIIRGTTILSDSYFQVGDVVKYKDIEGKVLVLGLKTTKIQDLKTSNVISIANRNIDEVQVLSNLIYVRIPMPYEVSVKKAEDVIEKIVERVKKCNDVKDCVYKGVAELADSSIQYLLQVSCSQVHKLQVNRDTIKEILLTLEENNISVPYNQIDVHQK